MLIIHCRTMSYPTHRFCPCVEVSVQMPDVNVTIEVRFWASRILTDSKPSMSHFGEEQNSLFLVAVGYISGQEQVGYEPCVYGKGGYV